MKQENGECYVCAEHIGNSGTLLTEARTSLLNTKITTKIVDIVGDILQIKVNGNDVICNQCVELFNQMDRHESNFELVKSNIRSLLIKKWH